MKEYTLQHIKKIATMKKEQPETKKEAAPVADYLNWWNGLKELQKNDAMDKANIDQRLRANQLEPHEIHEVYFANHPEPVKESSFSLIPELTADLTEGKEFGDNPIYLFLRGENDALKKEADILREALKPFADMFGELTEEKVRQGGKVYEYNKAFFTVADLYAAYNALNPIK